MANGDAWSQGWATGQRLEDSAKQQKKSRQEQLQDEQRHDKLSTYTQLFHDDRISPAEYAHAIEDVYHDAEPEHKFNLFSRAMNHKRVKKQHQQYLDAAKQRATEEQGIVTGAKPLTQIKDEAQKRALELESAKHPPKAEPAPKAPKAAAEPKPVRQTADERKRADFEEWKKTNPNYKGTYEEWAYKMTHPDKPPKAAPPQKLTPAQNHAQVGYLDALKLSNVADEVAKKPNDAVNQKRLAVALERISAGRFTTQALDYIIKAGWGNTIEQWANSPSTGALPADVMRQLIDGAHQNMQAAKSVLDEADRLAPKAAGGKGPGPKKIVVTPEDMKQ